MFKNYFKIAWRSLLKNKTVSIINITGLSVGMAAAILILLWVQNEFSYDTYYPNGNKIYRITFRIIPANGMAALSYLLMQQNRKYRKLQKHPGFYLQDGIILF